MNKVYSSGDSKNLTTIFDYARQISKFKIVLGSISIELTGQFLF